MAESDDATMPMRVDPPPAAPLRRERVKAAARLLSLSHLTEHLTERLAATMRRF